MIAPRSVRIAPVLLAFLVACAAGVARGGDSYPLSLAVVGDGERPQLLLAQRVIDREWGQSEDSVYVVVDVPEWRSEGLAGAMSAVVPGSGQIYSGDRRGVWYALAEFAGWTVRQIYRDRGRNLQEIASRYAGSPGDSSSRWSFARWAGATQQDPAALMALYEADRQVFYDLIARDPRYLAGWEGNPDASRALFADYRQHADDRLRFGRYASIGLWINHLVSGLDALRVARLHNLPLRRDLDLRVRGAWRHGAPDVTAMLVRRF